MTTIFETVAAKLAAGGRPSDRDVEALAAGPDLVSLGMLADEDRRRRHGRRVTFVRVAHVSVGDRGALADVMPGAAREIRLCGLPASADAAAAAVRTVAARAAGAPLTGFSLSDLVALAAGAGTSLDVFAGGLRAAGLDAVAGVPVELADVERAIDAVRAGGLLVLRLTVSRVDGPARLDALRRAAAIQRAVGGIAAFAPLPSTVDRDAPSTGYDDVKQVALARLVVDNIASIQVDWRAYGPKLAQVALTFGADDIDSVAAAEARDLGVRRATIEEIHRNIRAASLDPIERDGRFAVVET